MQLPFRLVGVLLVSLLLYPHGALAGCISDCADDYESEIDDCVRRYDEPDDVRSLERCIDDAHSEYEDCVHECGS